MSPGAPLAPLLFAFVIPGLGLPLARRLPLAPADRLVAALLLGIVTAALLGQACHLAALSPASWRLAALAASLAGWLAAGREARTWCQDAEARLLLRQSLVVAVGTLAALALVRTYSGGDWIGDWVGHFHRAHYFLAPEKSPPWVLALDPFTARPPLLNLATAVLLATGSADFASYQVFMTLLSLAAVPPLLRLARDAGGGPAAAAVLPAALLLHPLFMENATYSWTKLGCAAFVIAGFAAWLRHRRAEAGPHLALALFWLSAAVLAHYSAAPYVLALAALHLWLDRASLRRASWWGNSLRAALPGLVLAATWIAWAIAKTGWGGALGGDTTTVKQLGELGPAARLSAFGDNLLRTLLPPPWLGIDRSFLAHGNAFATVRDYAFSFYQTCLPGMVGLAGLLGLAAAFRPAWRGEKERAAFACALAALVVLGVAVHPAPMRWGAGHICLQPLALILLGLAAAAWPRLPPRLRAWAAALALLDAAFGVVLHFALQTIAVPINELARVGGGALRAEYGLAFANNAGAKVALELVLAGDLVASPALAAAVWALCVVLAVALARESPALPSPRQS